jgi:hypothetical protein
MRATRFLPALTGLVVSACGGGGGGNDGAAVPAAAVGVEAFVKPGAGATFHDFFGQAVALDDDTLVVGAPSERSNATGVDGNEGDVSLDGAGAAFVFVRGPGGWVREAYLKATDVVPASGAFGTSVAVSGDTVAVGMPFRSGGGAVYVFVRVAGVWTPEQKLVASNAAQFDSFGVSVAVDGDTLVVGAQGEDSNATTVGGDETDNSAADAGAAYVFVRAAGSWTQQAYLKASDGAAGARFGFRVDVSGDTAVVSAPSAAEGGDSRGAVYAFVRSGVAWSEQQVLLSSSPADGDLFGMGVAVDGDAVAVGTETNAAFVFRRSGTTWAEEAVLTTPFALLVNDEWQSVALSGDRVVVGALLEDGGFTGVDGDEQDGGAQNSGAAYLFERQGGAWVKIAYIKATDPGDGDEFGSAVAISGDTVAVGAPFEDSNAKGVNDPVRFDFAEDCGAVYVYR